MTESDARRLCSALSMLGSCKIYTLFRRDTGEEKGLAIFLNEHSEFPNLDELWLQNITPSAVNTKCPTSRSSHQRFTTDWTKSKSFVSEAPVSPTQERTSDEGNDTKVEMVTLKAVTKDEDTYVLPGQQVRYFKDWMSEQSTKGGAEMKKKGKVLCTLCNKFFTAKYLQKHQETMHKVEYPDTLKVESSIEKNVPKDENNYILPSLDVENKVEDYTFLSDVENSLVAEEEKYKQELGAIGGDNKILVTTPKILVQSSKLKGKRPGAGVSRQQPPKKVKKSLEKRPLKENLFNNLTHSVKEGTHQKYLEMDPATKKKNRDTVACELMLNEDTIVVDSKIDMKVDGDDGDNCSDCSDALGVGVESGRVKLSENDLPDKSQVVVGLDSSGAFSASHEIESTTDSSSIRRSRRLMQNQKKEVVVNGSSSKKSPGSNKKKKIHTSNSNDSTAPKNLDSFLVSNLTEDRNNNTDGGMTVTNISKGSMVTFICNEFDSDPLDRKVAQLEETNVHETSKEFPTLKERETGKFNVCEESTKNNLLGHLDLQQNKDKLMTDEKRVETDGSAVEVESKENSNDNYRTTLKPEIEGVKHLLNTTDSLGSATVFKVYVLNEGKENKSPDETVKSVGVATTDEKGVPKLIPECVKSFFETNTDAEESSPPQSSVNLSLGTPLPTWSVRNTNPEVINKEPKSQSEMPLASSSQPPISPARVSFTMKAQGNLIPVGKTKLLFNLSMKPNVPLIKGMLAFKEEIQAGVEELKFECEGRVLTGAELVNEVKGKAVLVSRRDAQSS